MLAVGDVDEAAAACGELEEIASAHGSDALLALSGDARGLVAAAQGDSRGALAALRAASSLWQELGAPYEAARTRASIGRACRALGDEDTAVLVVSVLRLGLGWALRIASWSLIIWLLARNATPLEASNTALDAPAEPA